MYQRCQQIFSLAKMITAMFCLLGWFCRRLAAGLALQCNLIAWLELNGEHQQSAIQTERQHGVAEQQLT